jgi:hypothetical protein
MQIGEPHRADPGGDAVRQSVVDRELAFEPVPVLDQGLEVLFDGPSEAILVGRAHPPGL